MHRIMSLGCVTLTFKDYKTLKKLTFTKGQYYACFEKCTKSFTCTSSPICYSEIIPKKKEVQDLALSQVINFIFEGLFLQLYLEITIVY